MTKYKKVFPIPQIIYRPLKDLVELEANPRKIDKKQMDSLIKSISENKEYFEARPLILSNRTKKLVILAGNQRFRASKVLKMVDCPTILIEGLTEAKEKEIIIRDNVSSGEWDLESLNSDWDMVKLDDWGVEIVDFKKTDKKSIDKNQMGDQVTLSLHFTKSKFAKVKTELAKYGTTPEEAVWKLLFKKSK